MSLKYELGSNLISGDVISDFMNLFVLTVDDGTPRYSAEYIIENGIYQGKYMKGSKWTVHTSQLHALPGALYIVGVYSDNECATRPLYINLPLNKCSFLSHFALGVDILGSEISFDATYIKNDNEFTIVMRGNSVMEIQYYLLYRETDAYVLDNELFRDENYIELCAIDTPVMRRGKRGRYIEYDVSSAIGKFHFAFVGCRVEDVKSKVVRIDLDHPVVIPPKPLPSEDDRAFCFVD